ncbi:MAG: diguanylate cyclase [Actinobacteria bacterium]|nr:diguanylate cyclase [Actinomycetota bacterium]
MFKNKSISKTYFINSILIFLFIIFSLSSFLIYSDWKDFREDCQKERIKYIESHKKNIEYMVNHVVNFTEFNIVKIKEQTSNPEQTKKLEQFVKSEILTWIQNIKFGENGYISVMNYDGKILTNNSINNYVGPNIHGSALNNSSELSTGLLKTLQDASKKADNNFIEYSEISNQDATQSTNKIILARAIDDWKWIIYSGFYTDSVEKIIAAKQIELFNNIKNKIIFIGVIILGAIMVTILITILISKRIKNHFKKLSLYFQKSATTYEKIDKENLEYQEFKDLSDYINEMVNEHQISERALMKEKESLLSILQNAPYGMILSEGEKILYLNSNFTSILGYTLEDLPTTRDFYKKFFRRQDSEEKINPEIVPNNNSKDNIKFDKVFSIVRNDGRVREIEFREAKLEDGRSILMLSDFTERINNEKKLKYLSFHDESTGLYNRAFFEEELKRLDTERQYPISIMMGDVNGLKIINDTFGHIEGDKLLIRIANIFRKVCRKEDIITRWGGDEFSIILQKTSESDSIEIINRIRTACSNDKNSKIPLSISLGVATKYSKEQSIYKIVTEAENRMYKRKLLENKSISSSIISSLARTLFEKSHETEEHTIRLQKMATKLGQRINLKESTLDEIALVATLHDIGKIAIPDNILRKTGNLNYKEWEIIKSHSEIGYRIAQSSIHLEGIANYILSHHERWDGTGYPQGLKEKEIPLISRIISIVDAYDTMVNGRIYKKSLTKEKIIEEFIKCSGSQFDPFLIEHFIDILKEEDSHTKKIVNNNKYIYSNLCYS